MTSIEDQNEIRSLRKQLKKLQERVSQIEAKIIADQPDVIKSVCFCGSTITYEINGNIRCQNCGTIRNRQTVL